MTDQQQFRPQGESFQPSDYGLPPDAGSTASMRDVETRAETTLPGWTPWARSDYELTIEHSPENQVYVARVDGKQIGHLDYKLVGGARRFAPLSTKVAPQFQHHGVGTHLIGAVLDDVRTTGKAIIDPVHPGVRENDPRLAANGSR
jgi:predicted GNAT family acetyltransferase